MLRGEGFLRFLVSWYLGCLVLGFVVSWFFSSLVSWLLGLKVSWLLGFKNSKNYQIPIPCFLP